MNQFITVDTQAEMDELLQRVHGFHDALLREVGIVSRGYVDIDGNMHGDVAPSDARLVIHSQSTETPYVEIIFNELLSISWDTRWDLDPGTGIVSDSGVVLQFGPYPEKFMVSAKKMSYRIMGTELLGKNPRTIDMIVESDY